MIIELNDFEVVALHDILNQIQEKIVGESEDWTEFYQKVLSKIITQLRKYHNPKVNKQRRTDIR